ncbi:MAG: hypothetical protein WKF81_07080, partial [Thermomicrobiales bacterium]
AFVNLKPIDQQPEMVTDRVPERTEKMHFCVSSHPTAPEQRSTKADQLKHPALFEMLQSIQCLVRYPKSQGTGTAGILEYW